MDAFNREWLTSRWLGLAKALPPEALAEPASLLAKRAREARIQGLYDRAGERVGQMRFTLAQRKQLGLGAEKTGAGLTGAVDVTGLRETLRPLEKELVA